MRSPRVLWAAAVAIIVVLAAIAFRLPQLRGGTSGDPRAAVSEWIVLMSTGEEVRGWRYLDPFTRERAYDDDRSAYLADAAATDWSGFDWRIADARDMEGIAWQVTVEVDGGLGAVPRMLLERNLVHPWCVDGHGRGFGVMVETHVFAPTRIGPGGLSGSARRDDCEPMPPPPEPDIEPSGEIAWVGAEMQFRNLTTLPIVLLNDGDHVSVPPCQAALVDGFGGEVEVRAAGGYIGTFGWEPISDLEPRTFFVVLTAEGLWADGARPAEPLPPCEGRPLVQRGE